MKTKLFLTGLAFMALTVATNAQNPAGGRGTGQCNGTGKGTAYVDKNKNGVCDNYENRSTNAQYKKGDGNACCKGQGKGKGSNFVDANKNGVCDNYETKAKK